MSKIYCPCIECVHNRKNHRCDAKILNFKVDRIPRNSKINSFSCDKYEISNEAKEIFDFIKSEIRKDKIPESMSTDALDFVR